MYFVEDESNEHVNVLLPFKPVTFNVNSPNGLFNNVDDVISGVVRYL